MWQGASRVNKHEYISYKKITVYGMRSVTCVTIRVYFEVYAYLDAYFVYDRPYNGDTAENHGAEYRIYTPENQIILVLQLLASNLWYLGHILD